MHSATFGFDGRQIALIGRCRWQPVHGPPRGFHRLEEVTNVAADGQTTQRPPNGLQSIDDGRGALIEGYRDGLVRTFAGRCLNLRFNRWHFGATDDERMLPPNPRLVCPEAGPPSPGVFRIRRQNIALVNAAVTGRIKSHRHAG